VIAFACPDCQKLIEVQQDALGTTVNCSSCGKAVVVTIDILFNAPEPAMSQPAPPKSIPYATKQVSGDPSSRKVAIQAGWAIALTVAFYLVIFVLGKLFDRQFTYTQKFLDRGWTPYVCVLLSFWCFYILFLKWRFAAKRNRCIATTSISPTVSLDSELGIQETVSAAWAAARQQGDDLLARRVEKLIEVFRSSRNPETVGEVLNVESDMTYGELESSYTLVRVFLWIIPILGFIGTVTGIGLTVGGFAKFLSVGPQELDDIKTALTKVTSELALAFDTSLIALLLTVIVMLALSYVESREKKLLQMLDDFCRDRLLPQMRAAKAKALAAAEDGFARGAEVLRGAIAEMREALEGFACSAGAEWAGQFEKVSMEAGRQSASELRHLREEMAHRQVENVELANQHLQQSAALQKDLAPRLDQIQKLLADLRENMRSAAYAPKPGAAAGAQVPAMFPQQPFDDQPGHTLPAPGMLLPTVDGNGMSDVLQDLQEGLQSINPFLRKLAERLRALADDPYGMKLRVAFQSKAAGEDA